MVFQPTGKNIWFRQIGSWNPLNFELKKYLNCQHLSTDIYMFFSSFTGAGATKKWPPKFAAQLCATKISTGFFPKAKAPLPKEYRPCREFLGQNRRQQFNGMQPQERPTKQLAEAASGVFLVWAKSKKRFFRRIWRWIVPFLLIFVLANHC